MTQSVSIGRIVHYVSHGTPGGEYGKECRAAVVTEVHGPALQPTTGEDSDMWDVSLAVLNPTGSFFNQHVVQDERGVRGGSWHWPEQVA